MAARMMLLLALAGSVTCSSSATFSAHGAWRAPIVDETTSLGVLFANGEQQVQTIADVVPGATSKRPTSHCVGTAQPGATALCLNVCVRIPRTAVVSKVETFAMDSGQRDWLPCSSVTCLGLPVTRAQAGFASNSFRDVLEAEDLVCQEFRNWSPTRLRQAGIRVTYRASPASPAKIPGSSASD